MRPRTLDKRHACTHSGRAARPSRRRPRTRGHSLSHPNISPPSPSAFTATITLVELRAENLTKCRPWHYSVAWDPCVRKPGHLDARLMTASNFPRAPAVTAQG